VDVWSIASQAMAGNGLGRGVFGPPEFQKRPKLFARQGLFPWVLGKLGNRPVTKSLVLGRDLIITTYTKCLSVGLFFTL
jgi:hypothetical protein